MLYEDTAPAFSRWLDSDFWGVCCCRLVHAQTHHAFTVLTLQTRGLSRAVLRQAALPAPLLVLPAQDHLRSHQSASSLGMPHRKFALGPVVSY